MVRGLSILAVAAALVCPAAATAAAPDGARVASATGRLSSAAAARPAARGGAVAVALGAAERYWHATPCGGNITIQASAAVPAGMASGTDAWVTFASAAGADNLEAPAATYTSCAIGLARWQWPGARAMRADWDMFCLTVVHEVGHLLGHRHSLAPGSVMAPVFTDESDVPAICRKQIV